MSRPLASAWLAASALIALGTPACDSDSSGGGSTAPTQIYEAWASTFCDVLVSCPTADDDLLIFTMLAKADKGACRTFAASMFEKGDPAHNIEKAVAEGRVTYRADQLGACLSAARSACSLDLDEVPACAAIFEGTVAAGGVCVMNDECLGDASCDQRDSSCPGTCKALAARGAACDWDGDCSQAAGPTACGSTSICVPLSTGTEVAEGGDCEDTVGETEVVDRHCAAGLHCDWDWESNTSTCKRYLAAGAACGGEDSAPCGAGLACVPSATGSTCGTVPIANSVGAACNDRDPSKPMAVCNLMKRLGCGADGKCFALGDGSVGSKCIGGFDIDGLCNFGTYCDDEALTCQPLKATGASCGGSSECQSGYCNNDEVCEAITCQ